MQPNRIDEIVVVTRQDNLTAGQPNENTTFSNEGNVDFDVQYWNGGSWATVSNGSITGNNKVLKKFQFSPITTDKIRVVVTDSLSAQYRYSRIVELEAWGGDTSVNSEVDLTYDALGNRTSMTDPMGNVQYAYDSLSQMTAETRQFNDTLADAPLSNNRFKLEYEYQLSGGLKSLKDPYGEQINYGYDKTGRLSSVAGAASYGGVTTYANNPQYRAWGGLKHLEYGNGIKADMTFDNGLRPITYNLQKTGDNPAMTKSYEYYSDGGLKYVEDELNPIFDRLNTYDHVGRIKEGKSGLEARGGTVTTGQDTQLPYRQSYQFNAFGNMTQRNNLHWGKDFWQGWSNNLTYTYENDRITNANWQHDADGRVTVSSAPDRYRYQYYDARGLLIGSFGVEDFGETNIESFYGGDGREIKRKRKVFTYNSLMQTPPYGTWIDQGNEYYIRSTVLGGQIVSEAGATGKKTKTNVFAAGAKIAVQSEYTYQSTTTESVNFEHMDASGMSQRSSLSNGTPLVGAGSYDGAPAETDPMGGNMGMETPYIEEPPPPPDPTPDFPFLQIFGDSPMYVNGQQVTCILDGMSIGCGIAMSMMEHGSALPAALAHLQGQPGFNFQSHGLGIFSATIPTGFYWADGGQPITANITFSFSFAIGTWGVTTIPTDTPSVSMTEKEIEDLRNKALSGLTPKCAAFIEKVAAAAGLDINQRTGEPLAAEDILGEAFDRVKNSPRDLDGKLRGFTWGWVLPGSGGMAGYGKIGALNENVAQIQYPVGGNTGVPLGFVMS